MDTISPRPGDEEWLGAAPCSVRRSEERGLVAQPRPSDVKMCVLEMSTFLPVEKRVLFQNSNTRCATSLRFLCRFRTAPSWPGQRPARRETPQRDECSPNDSPAPSPRARDMGCGASRARQIGVRQQGADPGGAAVPQPAAAVGERAQAQAHDDPGRIAASIKQPTVVPIPDSPMTRVRPSPLCCRRAHARSEAAAHPPASGAHQELSSWTQTAVPPFPTRVPLAAAFDTSSACS